MRVIVILLLPLHRIWKIGRVIECAGLEIRYTPFGYRGFESLIFRFLGECYRCGGLSPATIFHFKGV